MESWQEGHDLLHRLPSIRIVGTLISGVAVWSSFAVVRDVGIVWGSTSIPGPVDDLDLASVHGAVFESVVRGLGRVLGVVGFSTAFGVVILLAAYRHGICFGIVADALAFGRFLLVGCVFVFVFVFVGVSSVGHFRDFGSWDLA